MKVSEIKFTVELDSTNVPEKIFWEATDNPNEGLEQTKAISVAVWDNFHAGTLKIDLWTKDFDVLQMKRFVIDILGGLADTSRNATGDEQTAQEIEQLCQKLAKRLNTEMKSEL
jgi:gliding motility-associated protein GldC